MEPPTAPAYFACCYFDAGDKIWRVWTRFAGETYGAEIPEHWDAVERGSGAGDSAVAIAVNLVSECLQKIGGPSLTQRIDAPLSEIPRAVFIPGISNKRLDGGP